MTQNKELGSHNSEATPRFHGREVLANGDIVWSLGGFLGALQLGENGRVGEIERLIETLQVPIEGFTRFKAFEFCGRRFSPTFTKGISQASIHPENGFCVQGSSIAFAENSARGIGNSRQQRLNVILGQHVSDNVLVADGRTQIRLSGFGDKQEDDYIPKNIGLDDVLPEIVRNTLFKRRNISFAINPVHRTSGYTPEGEYIDWYTNHWLPEDADNFLRAWYREYISPNEPSFREAVQMRNPNKIYPNLMLGARSQKDRQFTGICLPSRPPKIHVLFNTFYPHEAKQEANMRANDSERREAMRARVVFDNQGIRLLISNENVGRVYEADKLLIRGKKPADDFYRLWNVLQTNAVYPYKKGVEILPSGETQKALEFLKTAYADKQLGPKEFAHQACKLAQMFIAAPRQTVDFLQQARISGLGICPGINLEETTKNIEQVEKLLEGKQNLDSVVDLCSVDPKIVRSVNDLLETYKLGWDNQPDQSSAWQNVGSLYVLTSAFAPSM